MLTPRARERGLVDVELGFTKSTGADGSRRVGKLLQNSLCGDVFVDKRAEAGVCAGDVFVYEHFEYQ